MTDTCQLASVPFESVYADEVPSKHTVGKPIPSHLSSIMKIATC